VYTTRVVGGLIIIRMIIIIKSLITLILSTEDPPTSDMMVTRKPLDMVWRTTISAPIIRIMGLIIRNSSPAITLTSNN